MIVHPLSINAKIIDINSGENVASSTTLLPKVIPDFFNLSSQKVILFTS